MIEIVVIVVVVHDGLEIENPPEISKRRKMREETEIREHGGVNVVVVRAASKTRGKIFKKRGGGNKRRGRFELFLVLS